MPASDRLMRTCACRRAQLTASGLVRNLTGRDRCADAAAAPTEHLPRHRQSSRQRNLKLMRVMHYINFVMPTDCNRTDMKIGQVLRAGVQGGPAAAGTIHRL